MDISAFEICKTSNISLINKFVGQVQSVLKCICKDPNIVLDILESAISAAIIHLRLQIFGTTEKQTVYRENTSTSFKDINGTLNLKTKFKVAAENKTHNKSHTNTHTHMDYAQKP